MRIIIIDDDSLVSLSLKTILEVQNDLEVVAVGSDGTEAIALYEKHLPDILLMDIRMKNMTGLEAAEKIISKHPDAKILLLTTFSDDEYIVKAIRIGAKGYILKQDFDSITPALLAVHNGQTVFGGEIMTKIPSLIANDNPQASFKEYGLSEKEFNIIQKVAEGLNNKEIASELFLGEGTVRNYISTILEKLDLRDRTQLAVFFYKNF